MAGSGIQCLRTFPTVLGHPDGGVEIDGLIRLHPRTFLLEGAGRQSPFEYL
jgi:hypothetical protein